MMQQRYYVPNKYRIIRNIIGESMRKYNFHYFMTFHLKEANFQRYITIKPIKIHKSFHNLKLTGGQDDYVLQFPDCSLFSRTYFE